MPAFLELLPAFLSWTTFGVVALATAVLAHGHRALRSLRDVAPATTGSLPSVSVLIPARDEARHLEAALRSVLALDYPRLEIVVVDDRSTDATGAILDRLAANEPRLTAVHVTELPGGWLGKNHAVHVAAERASGDLLLFTDADVVFESSTLRRAVAYLEGEGLDHLAIGPETSCRGPLLESIIGVFSVFFSVLFRPWKAVDPRSRAYIGIGAFGLVRRDVYQGAGGHRTVALRPDDDVKLGKVLKAVGARQEMLLGTGFVSVEWYRSVRELVRGLMKNAFAGVDYRPSVVVAGTAMQVLIFYWPLAALFWADGIEFAVNAASVAIALALFGASSRATSGRAWPGLLYPLALAIFVYIPWRSMVLALARGGIEWRGTLYPLSELRENRV